MTIKDRKKSYEEYIRALKASNGRPSKDTMELLKKAFTVEDADIEQHLSDIPDIKAMGSRSSKFAVLMEELRDMRDTEQISCGRSDILRKFHTSDLAATKDYVFIV